MFRVIVLYEQEPDAEQYAGHAEVCARVPGSTFRHGRVFGAPRGEPQHRYFGEWEFADRETFDTAAQSQEFRATGKDMMERGLPMPVVEFVELN